MSVRDSHVPLERLTALALVARAPNTDHDRLTMAHVSRCDQCSTALAQLSTDTEMMRDAAFADADAAFDESALETQRSRILDRIAHLGQAARVLRFPGRVREAAMPVSQVSRRWISVAAAAGLIIGLVTGQLLHLTPWETRLHSGGSVAVQTAAPRVNSPGILQTSAAVLLSDDDFLGEIDDAVQLHRAASLRALDAFTPRVGDLTEIR